MQGIATSVLLSHSLSRIASAVSCVLPSCSLLQSRLSFVRAASSSWPQNCLEPMQVLEQMRQQLSQAMAPESCAQQHQHPGHLDPSSQALPLPLASTSSALLTSTGKRKVIKPQLNASHSVPSQADVRPTTAFSTLLPQSTTAFGRLNKFSMAPSSTATATAPLAAFKASGLSSNSAANPAAFSWLQRQGLQSTTAPSHAIASAPALGPAAAVAAYNTDRGAGTALRLPAAAATGSAHIASPAPGSRPVPGSALAPHLGAALGTVNPLGSAGASLSDFLTHLVSAGRPWCDKHLH